MKYYVNSEMFKASNVTLSASSLEARSYNWWVLGKQIGKKYVLNTFAYSNSTIKHRYKVQHQLAELGIEPDLLLECPRGLQDLQSGVDHYTSLISDLQAAIDKPRSQKKTNLERTITIGQYSACIKQLQSLMKEAK